MTKRRKVCIDMRGLSSQQKDELIKKLDQTVSDFRRKQSQEPEGPQEPEKPSSINPDLSESEGDDFDEG